MSGTNPNGELPWLTLGPECQRTAFYSHLRTQALRAVSKRRRTLLSLSLVKMKRQTHVPETILKVAVAVKAEACGQKVPSLQVGVFPKSSLPLPSGRLPWQPMAAGSPALWYSSHRSCFHSLGRSQPLFGRSPLHQSWTS